MATPNPMETTYGNSPPSMSKKIFSIAGILTTVYGLDQIPPQVTEVACLWLLHPRLQTQACMEPIAASAITDWNRGWKEGSHGSTKGLIAVSFDQRNHGSREVDKLANEAWRHGNEKHAQDMFSIYQRTITTHLVLGISLGGHSAWQCLLHDARISAAIVVIGCPDYVRLMTDRAAKSKLQTWTQSSPPGSEFLGSKDFPQGLVKAIDDFDPTGLLVGRSVVMDRGNLSLPSETEQKKLRPLMEKCLAGKRLLNLAGGVDKLVPYKCAEPFMTWLKRSVGKDGWFADGNVVVEDIVFDGVGHEMSPGMVNETIRFVSETLASPDTASDSHGSSRGSKM
ncbi:MAG: hypothetical protein M1827_003647 [Pycnora praestabilis]|nr:MAG: hypothetical protein M1827_003647 [Pycnora praestabilis]